MRCKSYSYNPFCFGMPKAIYNFKKNGCLFRKSNALFTKIFFILAGDFSSAPKLN